jgi:NO-binding membrane sensor protein with MHYT domain
MSTYSSLPGSATYGKFTDWVPAKTLVYAGGAAAIARDGQTVLIGDNLVATTNGSIMTLAFVIGLVACWSALILVEQVLYAAEKQQRWWIWATACALVQGGPGVWALHMIGMCALSLPAPVDLEFNPVPAGSSFAVTFVLSVLAFYTGLYGWQQNKAWVDKGSTHHHSVAPLTGKAAAEAAANASSSTAGGSTGGGSSGKANGRKYEYEDTQNSLNQSTSGENQTVGTYRRRKILQMSSDHTIWGQLKVIPFRVNKWFVLSGLILSGTTMICHGMISGALPSAYGQYDNPMQLILFLVIGTPAFMFAILLVFYFFPTVGVRFMAAVFMHSMNFIGHIVAMSGMSFTYSENTDGAMTYWWDPSKFFMLLLR